MRTVIRRANRLLGILVPRLGAALDARRPHLFQAWGGPFNGQVKRQELFLEILSLSRFEAIVETGAYRGTTTAYLRQASGLPVYTVEVNARYFHFCRRRFRDDGGVHILLGSSPRQLRHLAEDPAVPRSNVFFYLDAHWGRRLPLLDELDVIAGSWSDSVVMIDDFRVPADDGYAYDAYEGGAELSREYVDLDRIPGMDIYWPAAPSSSETGERRGCVVLGSSGAISDALRDGVHLRPDHHAE